MAGDTSIVIIGNLTADPELKFIPSGKAVANFTIASTPRTFNKNTNEWEDGEALFMRCSVWDRQAENVAEGFVKGDRVIATGIIKQRSYDTAAGEKRTVIEMQVEEIGASAKFRAIKHATKATTAAAPATELDPWTTSIVDRVDSSDIPPF